MKQTPFLLSIVLVSVIRLSAQNFSGGFSFNLPPSDSSTQKFLPQFPVSPIDNEHFVSVSPDGYFMRNGERIRFWGANLVADGAFPAKMNAASIAGRLRKYGFNLIRMHHLDNSWGENRLFYPGQSTRNINTATRDRMEYLIAELKKNGVFVNMNLNVSRQFTTQDGIPDADSLTDMAKGVTLFDPQLKVLQKEYAMQMLGHVNPYTGLTHANDPVIAMVEIVNENSLYRMWVNNVLKPQIYGGGLTFRHTAMLDSAWNAFLKTKYGTTTALQNAWSIGASAPGEVNLVQAGDFETTNLSAYWAMEQHNGAVASFSRDAVNPYRGSASVKVAVTTATGTYWHVQFKQSTISVKKDSVYRVSFAVRADSVRSISVGVMRNNDPYTYYGGSDFQVGTQWKVYTLTVRAPEANSGQTRLTFQFPAKGTYWFDSVSIVETGADGLLQGENIESASVKRIDFSQAGLFTDNRVRDMSQFYIALQDSFFADMYRYLKQVIGVKAPVCATNWNVGPADLAVQSKLDYIDNHAYWDHPNFPGVPWSSTDWYINNTPMVSNTDGGTIGGMFNWLKIKGKPMTVSEYNHVTPNVYQNEGLLFLAGYAGYHDIDGIMLFDYNSISSWDADKINGYFDVHRNTACMSMMPAIAKAFRLGQVRPAQNHLMVQLSQDDINLLPKKATWSWSGPQLYNNKIAITTSIQTESFAAAQSTNLSQIPVPGASPYKSDTGELLWDTQGLFTVTGKQFVGFTGKLNTLGGRSAGCATLASANVFGTVLISSLTPDSIPVSRLNLLTVATRSQNTGMVWSGTTTVNNNWGTTPTLTQPMQLNLIVRLQADSIYCYPLGALGEYSQLRKYVVFPTAPNSFAISLNTGVDKTVWYGIETFGTGTGTEKEHGALKPDKLKLFPAYPNPFNGTAQIVWEQPGGASAAICIYSVTGAEVRRIETGISEAGKFSYAWDAKDSFGNSLAAGIYIVRLHAGEYSSAVKLLYLK